VAERHVFLFLFSYRSFAADFFSFFSKKALASLSEQAILN